MAMHWTRRQFVVGTTMAAGAAMASATGAEAAAWQDAVTDGPAEKAHGGNREKVMPRIMPFPMTQVRLLPGIFATEAEYNQKYLDSLDVDRLMYSFRVQAGITPVGKPYGGWEKPDCELRGHFNGGHYLSASALAYASSGNESLKRKGDAVVAVLAECQRKNGAGYISAFPTTYFDRLVADQKVWAPFYTIHKIMAGLLDMYIHTGNEQALAVAEGMAEWVGNWTQKLTVQQLQQALTDEYGGMNEVLANLYAVTGKEAYLATARRFEQPVFLDPLAARRDQLKGLHANTHVPKVIGAARMYELTGETRYRTIAEYFLNEVLTERSYSIGNTSNDESWRTDPGELGGQLSFTNAECCVAYNLMKLMRHVASWTGDPHWMDAYERTLFNARLGTQNPDGLKMYYYPLAAGYWKLYHSKEGAFWCCTGTGAEEFAKLNDTIYFHDGAGVYVNQFISSELPWPEHKLRLRQETRFPVERGTLLTMKLEQPAKFALNLRIPAWVTAGGSVSVNGKPLEVFAQPGAYLTLTRTWQSGDTVKLTLPMKLRAEPLNGDPTMQSALYGPLVLAGLVGGKGPEDLRVSDEDYPKNLPPAAAAPEIQSASATADWVEPVSEGELKFRTAGQSSKMSIVPLYQVTDERYAVYFKAKG